MSGENTASRDAGRAPWIPWAEVGLILAVFVLNSAWPVPDSNEPCYLAKAKHFWNPGWGSGQLFLESGNAHAVFYLTFGWLCRWLPLPAAAWVIRSLTWTLLAWAWRRLSWAAIPRAGWAVLSAVLMVALNERFNLAGEWIVGGAEAKGFAYVLVFLALERLVRDDWRRVWPLLGLATSFHVLVGGWSFAAAGLAWLLQGHDRPPARSQAAWLGLGCLLAAPGVWGVLRLNAGVDAETLSRAARILVFERSPHHLSPLQFSVEKIVRHLALWGAWLALVALVPPAGQDRRLRWFVASAMLFAALGVAVALVTRDHPHFEARLLQVYWFRLSDAAVPVGVALASLAYVDRVRAARPRLALGLGLGLVVAGGVYLGGRCVRIVSADAPRADSTVVDPSAWREVCLWISDHTPPDARFLTPRGGGTFGWYSGRWDVVNWKDHPQDAAGLVEWWRRMREIHGAGSPSGPPRWRTSLGELGADRLCVLGREYSADYAVIVREPDLPPLSLDELYSNRSYLVVRLRDPGQGGD